MASCHEIDGVPSHANTWLIRLDILSEQLSFTDINKKSVVESGDFEIMIGNSSMDQDLTKVVL